MKITHQGQEVNFNVSYVDFTFAHNTRHIIVDSLFFNENIGLISDPKDPLCI